MKIVTWNINGIRTVRGPLKTLLDSFGADVICLQETKVSREMLDESIAAVDGYNAYFSYSRKKGGYSGVVTYCRDSARPVAAEEGISGYWAAIKPVPDVVGSYGSLSDWPIKELQRLDEEGRTVITQHQFRKPDGSDGSVCIINVYCPRADQERDDRKAYKLWFCQMLQTRTEALLDRGRYVVIVGDLNTSHRPLDTCDSSGADYATSPTRQWMNDFLIDSSSEDPVIPQTLGHRMIDTFRECHPDREKAYTCWSTATGARALNYGTRIDYILADVRFTRDTLRMSEILPEMIGSDHCPVVSEFDVFLVAAEKCPSLCAKWMPEFTGKQQKLSSFFLKAVISADTVDRAEVEIINPTQQSSKRLRLTDTVSKKVGPPSGKKKRLATVHGQKSLLDFFGKKTPESTNDVSSCGATETFSISSSIPRNQSSLSYGAVYLDLPSIVTDHVRLSSAESSFVVPLETGAPPSATCNSSTVDFSWTRNSEESVAQWKSMLSGPKAAPLCTGHSEPCVLKTTKKTGPNRNRNFYMCSRPEGEKTDINARCGYFKWVGCKGS